MFEGVGGGAVVCCAPLSPCNGMAVCLVRASGNDTSGFSIDRVTLLKAVTLTRKTNRQAAQKTFHAKLTAIT